MIILVTGASGYLGSQLANYLSKKHKVFALIRDSSSVARLERRVGIKKANNMIELDAVLNTTKPNVIINTVALYGRKEESLSKLVEANIYYPIQAFELANKHGVKAYIHTGTSLPRDLSAYSLTKDTFSKLIQYQSSQVKFINIKLEHFYGPSDDTSKFISYVIERCMKNDKLDLTSGKQKRDFIFIEDVLSAYDLMIENIDVFNDYQSIPLGSGEAIEIRNIVEIIATLTNSATELNFGIIPIRDNELMYSCANTTFLNQLGWQAKYSLHEGLNLTISEQRK